MIASRVMLFNWDQYGFIETVSGDRYQLAPLERLEFATYFGRDYPLYQPTRHINQAWQALEKVNLPFEILGAVFSKKHIYCKIFVRDIKYEAVANTAPLAICEAILKAIET